jgi:hypothetical protein
LNESYQPGHPFPVIEAVELLGRLHPNNQPNYRLAINLIHYCAYQAHHQIEEELLPAFEAMRKLPLKALDPYLNITHEPFKRTLLTPKELLSFANKRKMSASDVAHLLLKSAVTYVNQTQQCPYLNGASHLQFIQDAEVILGIQFPNSIIFKLLYVLAVKKEAPLRLFEFVALRNNLINDPLNRFSLPANFDIDFSSRRENLLVCLPLMYENLGCPQIYEFIEWIEMAIYPWPYFKLPSLDSKEGKMKLFLSDSPASPAYYCKWEANNKQPLLIVSLLNSVDCLKKSVQFKIQFPSCIEEEALPSLAKLIEEEIVKSQTTLPGPDHQEDEPFKFVTDLRLAFLKGFYALHGVKMAIKVVEYPTNIDQRSLASIKAKIEASQQPWAFSFYWMQTNVHLNEGEEDIVIKMNGSSVSYPKPLTPQQIIRLLHWQMQLEGL